MDNSTKRKLITLVSKLHDQTLSDTEKRELEQLLQSDSEVRKCYFELTELELTLQDDSILQTDSVTADANTQTRPNTHLFTFAKVAALLLIGSFSSVIALKFFTNSDLPAKHPTDLRPTVGIISELQGSLRRTDGTRLEPREDLIEGDYQLEQGSARFDFFAGVSVELEAPGTFTVVSPVHMNVQQGNLAVEVHDARSMFKITSSKSAYVDLGTEFSINVDQDGSSELHVYEGSVLASSLSKQGNSERIQLVKRDQTLTISGQETPFSSKDAALSLEKLPRIKKPIQAGLHLTQRYSGSVLNSDPEAYWTFDPSNPNTQSIEATKGNQSLKNIGETVRTIDQGANTFLQFEDCDTFGALSFENLVHFDQNQSFSVEFWIRPDRINRATVFAIYDPDSVKPNGETNHLALIDLMHTPISFHHVPAAIRSAIRPIPSDDYYSGINMFTNEHYVPGVWMHIAFVKAETYGRDLSQRNRNEQGFHFSLRTNARR